MRTLARFDSRLETATNHHAELGFLYVFPDGTEDSDGILFWNATDAGYDFFGSGVDDPGYLRALIEEIIVQLNVDSDRIYAIGHSNGGSMVFRMACDHAELIAGIASLAGATSTASCSTMGSPGSDARAATRSTCSPSPARPGSCARRARPSVRPRRRRCWPRTCSRRVTLALAA